MFIQGWNFEEYQHERDNLLNIVNLELTLYGSYLWMGFNCLKANEPLRGTLLFTTKSPVLPGTHLINFGMMKG